MQVNWVNNHSSLSLLPPIPLPTDLCLPSSSLLYLPFPNVNGGRVQGNNLAGSHVAQRGRGLFAKLCSLNGI